MRESLRLYPPAHVTTRECTAAGGATLTGRDGQPIHVPQGTWWVGLAGGLLEAHDRRAGVGGAPRVILVRALCFPIACAQDPHRHLDAAPQRKALGRARGLQVNTRPAARTAALGCAGRPALPPLLGLLHAGATTRAPANVASARRMRHPPFRHPSAAGLSGSCRRTRRRRRGATRTSPSAWGPATVLATSLRCRRCSSRWSGEACQLPSSGKHPCRLWQAARAKPAAVGAPASPAPEPTLLPRHLPPSPPAPLLQHLPGVYLQLGAAAGAAAAAAHVSWHRLLSSLAHQQPAGLGRCLVPCCPATACLTCCHPAAPWLAAGASR